MTERKIVTKYESHHVLYPWSARREDYELGDLVGVGDTEQDAVEDLKNEEREYAF